MTAILTPKQQLKMIITEGKTATLRKPTFKVNTAQTLKFINNFKYGVFAEAVPINTQIINVEDITNSLAHKLGYASKYEYLKNGWNSQYDQRLLIEWDNIKVNYDVIKKLRI